MTLRHCCRPTMRSTGRHSHSNFKTFVIQIKILMWQITGESLSLLKAVLLDLFKSIGHFKSNYLFDQGPLAVLNAILSRFSATTLCEHPECLQTNNWSISMAWLTPLTHQPNKRKHTSKLWHVNTSRSVAHCFEETKKDKSRSRWMCQKSICSANMLDR